MPLRPKYRARLKHMTNDEFRDSIMKVVRDLEAMVAVLLLAVILGAIAMWPLIIGRTARIDYVNDQFRSLYCMLVQGVPDDPKDPRIAKVRTDNRCPPYAPLPAQTKTSTPEATPSAKPSDVPGAAGKPSPTPGPSGSGAGPGAGDPRPGTVTRNHTVTHSRTVTRSVHPGTPTQSGQSPIESVLCPLPPLICLPIERLPI